MKTPLLLSVMVAALAVIGYMLFWDFDVVWPFFLLPYLVFSILFLIRYFRAKEKNLFSLFTFLLIIIPVFSGLTMSLGWMIYLDFLGEMLRSIMNQ